MTELSRKILDAYQIRKTKKQKQAFIDLLQMYIPSLQVQETGFPKSRNLVIGNPETAKAVLCAHYDTCSQLPFPNFITPKRPLISICYSLLTVIPFLGVIVALNFLLGWFGLHYWLHYWISMAGYILVMALLLAGPANKHTANDNTSGVITLIETYNRLSEAQRQEVCLVFFDNEEKGVLGSAQFRKKYRGVMKNKLLINFDCVSDGDTFLLGISKKANQKYHVAVSRAFPSTDQKTVLKETLNKVYYPSDQAGFPMAIAVAALKHSKVFGYYMDRIHTKRDTVFQEENIAYLAEHTAAFMENL